MRLEMDRPSSPGPSHNLPPPPAMEATQDPPTSADRAAAARKVHNISSPVGVMRLPPRSKQLVVCGTISTDEGQHHLVQCLLDPAAETNVCSREFAVCLILATRARNSLSNDKTANKSAGYVFYSLKMSSRCCVFIFWTSHTFPALESSCLISLKHFLMSRRLI